MNKATVNCGAYTGQTGIVIDTHDRAGETRALVRFSDGAEYWYLPGEYETDNPRRSGRLPIWAPDWTDDQIRREFDRDHSMTVRRLCEATMRRPSEIKRILRNG